jgi:NAD/NADP transhydrogenase beta subunit
METGSDPSPSRDEAQAILESARQAETETRNPPLPRLFFITQAALLALIATAQMLPESPSRVITILGLVAVAGVGMRAVFARPGYGFIWPDGRATFPYMIAMLILVGVPAVAAVGLEVSWLWLVAGALAGLTTLEMGRRYRRAFRRV